MNGGTFDWSNYLPKGKRKGKWTPKVSTDLCNSGYHVTEYWNMWYKSGARVFEVETKGAFTFSNAGVCDKEVYESIRLVREVDLEFNVRCNTGNHNTGDHNTGDYNTGYRNTGYRNTGNRNTGRHNTGNHNTGNYNTGNRNTGRHNTGNHNTGNHNTGDYNTGGCNTGYRNTGYRNTGKYNTGNYNTGYHNTGDHNTGNRNTGYRNTGKYNTGNYNTGDYNTGFFNTTTPDIINVFNKPCSIEEWDKAEKPNFLYFELDESLGYKGSFQKAYELASDKDKKLLKNLPNFDANVFYENTGIKV